MEQHPHKVKILGAETVRAKLRRMAYEIYEHNYDEQDLLLIGLGSRGYYLATHLRDILQQISALKVARLEAEKGDSNHILLTDAIRKEIPGKVVIIVDDVLYSGLTMFSALAGVMEFKPVKVQIAVLIDRGHRNVPVSHDFVGMELATSLQQYVSVEIDESQHKAVAYLF